MEAVMVAKQLAPAGRPEYELIIKEGTGLGVWNKLYGQETTAKYIFLFLVSLNKYFNVVRPMTTEQMQDLSIEFSGYTVFKFEDFIAFFEGVKHQRFGEIRDRIDPALLWSFFRKYDEQRDNECERLAREKQFVELPKEQDPVQKILSGPNKLSDVLHQLKNHIKND